MPRIPPPLLLLLLLLLLPLLARAQKLSPIQHWLRLDSRFCETSRFDEKCASSDSDVFGGCAFSADSTHLWCCPLGKEFCYGGTVSGGCSVPDAILCKSAQGDWCCDGPYEECGAHGLYCRPRGVRNPYRDVASVEVGEWDTATTTVMQTVSRGDGTRKTASEAPEDTWTPKTVEATATGTAAGAAETAAAPKQQVEEKKSNAAVIGGAVGGGVGALAVAVGGLLLLRRRKRRADQTGYAYDGLPVAKRAPEQEPLPYLEHIVEAPSDAERSAVHYELPAGR